MINHRSSIVSFFKSNLTQRSLQSVSDDLPGRIDIDTSKVAQLDLYPLGGISHLIDEDHDKSHPRSPAGRHRAFWRNCLNKNTSKLIICFLGIFVSYLVFGIIQESILKGTYANNQKFTCILSLVLFLCFFNVCVSKLVLILRQSHRDKTSTVMYISSSLTYVCAMLTSNYALEFVSYPMQVLSKSIKPVPVMLLGVVVARKRYPLVKYFYVLLIVLGVILFMYKEPKEDSNTLSQTSAIVGIGEISLVASLIFDGLTGGIQDKIRDKHQAQAYHMMYSMNLWSCLWTALAILFSNEVTDLLVFLENNPSVLPRIFLLGLTGAIGQNFIFLTVEWFGPLTCAIFTTTRKFFTILCSVLIFGNLITFQQICGTCFVFLGLFLDQLHGKKKH